MPKFLIYRRSLKGPSPALLVSRQLDQYEKESKLTEPIQIKPEEENLPFVELMRLYPPPKREEL